MNDKDKSTATENNRIIIGHIENIDLPELGISQMTARVDTGAQTSSLHVDNITRIKKTRNPLWFSIYIPKLTMLNIK